MCAGAARSDKTIKWRLLISTLGTHHAAFGFGAAAQPVQNQQQDVQFSLLRRERDSDSDEAPTGRGVINSSGQKTKSPSKANAVDKVEATDQPSAGEFAASDWADACQRAAAASGGLGLAPDDY